MNWKKEAADKLRNYTARQQAVTNISEQLRSLEIKATSIRSASVDGTPVQGGGSGREDAMLNNIVNRAELERQLEQARIWCRTVERALSVLTDQERLVLDRFYIHPAKGNLDRLCQEFDAEVATVYRKRDAALHRFTIALFGFDEYRK